MFSLTCKRAVALISVALDGKLSLRQRLLLRLHLRICAACRRFQTQLLLLRRLVRQPEHARVTTETNVTTTLSPTARARIERSLRAGETAPEACKLRATMPDQ